MIKNLLAKRILPLTLIICVSSSCEESELTEIATKQSNVKVETIDGSTDPEFMKLIEPFTEGSISGRVLYGKDFQRIKKLTGDDYVNYTVPIPKASDEPFASHSLILSLKNDTVTYNLLEIIPDINWNGNFAQFSGAINTYLITFDQQHGGNSSGRTMTDVPNNDCLEFVIDNVVVHADLSATAYGHWQDSGDCGNSSGGGWTDYYWVPNWDYGSGGNWSGGGQTGSGGGGGGSGSGGGRQEVPISLEEALAAQVEQVLAFDPTALLEINCDQIGKWQALVQHHASDAIKNKVNALQNTNNSFDDWAIQTLNEASGTIVNMDYFSVNVTQLPMNSLTGVRFTPEGFKLFQEEPN